MILGIPETMAEVKESYMPPTPHRLQYVLIEDVHDNSEAQGKIAAILLYAHHHWGSRRAFIEGAFGLIGPPPFPIFTAERGDLSVSELLQRGLVSGGELAAALSSHGQKRSSFEVTGMDNRLMYLRQLEAYGEVAQLQAYALKRLRRASRYLRSGEQARLRSLLQLRMTPADYQAYLEGRRLIFSDPALTRAVRWAEEYYRMSDLRSQSFIENARFRSSDGPSLLVMGGFHTSVIRRILRQRQESFIVLSPRLAQAGAPQRYRQCLEKNLETLHRFPTNSLYASRVSFLRLTLAHKRHFESTN